MTYKHHVLVPSTPSSQTVTSVAPSEKKRATPAERAAFQAAIARADRKMRTYRADATGKAERRAKRNGDTP